MIIADRFGGILNLNTPSDCSTKEKTFATGFEQTDFPDEAISR